MIDSIAFQQHASGRLSTTKPYLFVCFFFVLFFFFFFFFFFCFLFVCFFFCCFFCFTFFDLRTHPSFCNLAIVIGFYWVVVFKPMLHASIIFYRRLLLKLSCLNTSQILRKFPSKSALWVSCFYSPYGHFSTFFGAFWTAGTNLSVCSSIFRPWHKEIILQLL